MDWDSITDGQRIEVGALQVDIAGHSRLQGSDRAIKDAKGIFRQQIDGIAQIRGGRPLNWAGDGGSFLFLTGDGSGFDRLVLSAIQMLNSLPAINDEIAILTDFDASLSMRISCGSGTVTYDHNPGEISGDFLNRFLKHERDLGLENSVSVTDDVRHQLSSKLRKQFVPFKRVPGFESLIYNYGGKKRQHDILASLRNVVRSGRQETPYEEPESVEVVTFHGDTLFALSKVAYADVIVEGFPNVGGINLLVSKNADICLRHRENSNVDNAFEHGEQISDDELIALLHRCDIPAPQINRIRDALNHFPCGVRRQILARIKAMPPGELHRLASLAGPPEALLVFLGRLEHERHGHDVQDPLNEFQGGERIRFYNCAALGYLPHIGSGTMLDNVFAGNLTIASVLGGVPEPTAKMRVFESVDGAYREVRDSGHGTDTEPRR